MTGQNEAVSGAALVEALQIGDPQVHGPLVVFPLRLAENGGPGYVTLRQAIAGGQAAITEVSEGGSVPELRVVNKGDRRVLVLDGEELRGAKQNRVLNTSILIGGHSSLVVPVSCTEQGRWSYASREFDASEFVADRQVRYAMKESVSVNLASGVGHRSDQGRVWQEVGALHERHMTSSPTGAMRDAYQLRKGDLDSVLDRVPASGRPAGDARAARCPGGRSRPRLAGAAVRRAPRQAAAQLRLRGPCGRREPGDRAVADAFLERIADLPGGGTRARASAGTCATRAPACSARRSRTAGTPSTLRSSTSAGSLSARRAARVVQRPRPDWRIADARERARRRRGH